MRDDLSSPCPSGPTGLSIFRSFSDDLSTANHLVACVLCDHRAISKDLDSFITSLRKAHTSGNVQVGT
jgi:hypothetical protein